MKGPIAAYLNHQKEPGVVQRYPRLLFVYYWLNRLLHLRTWYIRTALRRELKWIPAPRTFLDAGCGTGDFIFGIPELTDDHITGIDLSPSNIAMCTRLRDALQKDRFSFRNGDLSTAEFPPDQDIILHVAVLMYIPDDTALLEKFHTALHQGGTLLLYVPVNTRRYTCLEQLIPRRRESDYNLVMGVHHEYTSAEIMAKVEGAGFSIDSHAHAFGPIAATAYEIHTAIERLIKSGHPVIIPLLIVLFVLFLPFNFCAMLIDVCSPNRTGNGLMIVARKP